MKTYLMLALGTVAVVRAFMSEIAETVIINGPNGPVRVNKSDYDADQSDKGAKSMTLHKEQSIDALTGGGQQIGYPPGTQPTAAPSAPNFGNAVEHGAAPVIDPNKNAVAPSTPSPNTLLVAKEGTEKKPRFFVVDGTGAHVEAPSIDKDGYETEANAWAAAMAVMREGQQPGQGGPPAPVG